MVFANFAESIAEGRGKAAADALRAQRVDVKAKLIVDDKPGLIVPTPAYKLAAGDVVLVEAGDMVPADGEIIEGVASVNEAAITGESAPVIREAGGDRSAVTGGTTVVSDWIKVRITAEPGQQLPRPHDRHGRGRRAAQDAQRDGADRAAGRPDPDLPDRRRRPCSASASTPASSSTRWCWARCSSA